jgi:ribose transport system permease protein
VSENRNAPTEAAATVKTSALARVKTSALARMAFRVPEWAALFVVLVALFVFFSFASKYFFQPDNFKNIAQNVAVIGIIACPATILMIAAQFDLSVGSVVAFSGMFMAISALLQGTGGATVPIAFNLQLTSAFVLTLFVAGVIGVINAFAVNVIGINALITTLGTLSVFRGLTKVLGDGQTIRIENFDAIGITRDPVLGIPLPVYIFGIVIALTWFVLRYTVYGRSMYAIGASPAAARLAGIRSKRALFIAFIASSLAAGLGGLILLSQVGGASVNAGIGVELSVVTAVVLGGTSLSGGRGGVGGTILAVFIIGVLQNGLIQLNIASFWIEVANGLLLLGAVSFDRLRVRLTRSTG